MLRRRQPPWPGPRGTAEHEAGEWARGIHAGKRGWMLAFLGNGLLLLGMLGLPYARGHWRAHDIWRGHASAAACLLGGEAAKEPGLGRIEGWSARFAERVLDAQPGWLKACDRALAELVPAEAVFVWPTAKAGETQVREAVRVLRHELAQVAQRKPGERVPARPLRAFDQLLSVLHDHAREAGVFEVPPQPAVAFKRPARVATPARVPFSSGVDAVITLWGDDTVLNAVGVDRTGVSYARVAVARVLTARLPRPKLLQSFLRFGDEGFLAYAKPLSECRGRPGGCASKAMGLSKIDLPLTQLPSPRWLSSHPADRLDRSLARTPHGFLLAAEGADGQIALREFVLPEALGGDADAALPPVRWHRSSDVVAAQLLMAQATEQLAVARSGEDAALQGVQPGSGESSAQPVAELATLPKPGAAWVVDCVQGSKHGFAFGGERALALGEREGDSARTWPVVPLATGAAAIHERDHERDRVVRVCVPGGALAIVRDEQDRLWSVFCGRDAAHCAQRQLASGIAGFSVLALDRAVLLAYAGEAQQAQVLVQRLDQAGAPLGAAAVPSPCWAPRGGLCDQPHLAQAGSRIVLAARDQGDLMVLESPDGGVHWEPLAYAAQP